MAIADTREKNLSHGIGPVSREWLKGARKYLSVLKKLDDDVTLREAAVVEREFRYGRYRNPLLPVLMDMQKCHPEVWAGFAAMLCDLLSVQFDGNNHDAEHVRKLLKTATIS